MISFFSCAKMVIKEKERDREIDIEIDRDMKKIKLATSGHFTHHQLPLLYLLDGTNQRELHPPRPPYLTYFLPLKLPRFMG
jgi:hypothetical protein